MIRKKRMGKGIAKILSGLLVFGMVAGLVPAVPDGTVHAKAAEISGQNVTTAENPEHKHCVCGKGEHPNNGQEHQDETWTGIDSLDKISSAGYYYLKDNVTIQSAWNCPDGVTLCLNGHSITREGEGSDAQDIYGGGNAVIKINKNISFALTDCQETVGTITHKAGVSGEGVYNAGKFTMYNGKLSGNNGGVTNQRTFEMYGGTICQNTAEYGGGVYNKNTGTFNMYSGTITDNTARTGYYDGGGGVYNEGMFSMSGGHIFQNKSTNHGGGVNNGSGTFEMSGGEIFKNTTTNCGGGVFNKGGTFIMSDAAKISENTAMCGGGVYKESGTFTMSGGTITGNTAAGSSANASGGGVYNKADAFTMSGGTITQNESQYSGGGVYYKSGIFLMSGGAIADNETKEYGGGVCNEDGTFEMSGGEITRNKSEKNGGGVQHASQEPFKMSGTAKITNNTAISNGGGVLVARGYAITLGGEVEITGNKVGDNRDNNLYLGRETTVQTEDSLTGKETIGVTAYDTPTDDSPVTITSNPASAENFKSDNSAYEIGTDAIGRVILKKTTTCNVIVSIPDNGSIKHIMNYGGLSQKVTKGNSIEPIILEAGEGYYFSDADISNLTRDGISTTKQADGSIKIEGTPNSDISFTATASKKPDTTTHTITATVEGGKGTISPNGSVSVKEGESQVFTITPNKGYEIASLKVDGKEVVNPSNTYTFTNVTSGHTIDVSFKEQAVVPPAVEAPTITKQPQPVSVKVGETATFTVEAAGEGLSYQWMVDKKDNAEFVNIDEATSESYTLNAASKEFNGYQYQCVVSNQSGSVTSNPVTLTVTEDTAPTPNPNPTPTPEPNPEPNPTPTPNPAPEATTPTPATSTPAASTTTAPASSASSAPAQVTYDILDGAGSSWTQNTDGSLAIRGSGEISKFREVKVDGVTVDPVNYTVTEGSTIITFKPEYLKSLSAGNHSFELVWTDGTAATNFTVAENADQSAKSPKTGEDFSMALCTALLMMSCAGLAGMFVRRKKSSLR